MQERLETYSSVIPAETRYLFGWFCEISHGRGSNGWGPVAVSSSEILAWSQLSGHRLLSWEVAIIRELDSTWLRVYADLHRQDKNEAKPQLQ